MEPFAFFRNLARRAHAVPAPRGFTLVEMMTVLAIILIISTIALLGQNTFNRTLLLTDTAYTVALSIREAQSFGLSSRAFGSIENAGYGAYFSTATPNTYLIFADISTPPTQTIPATCPRGLAGTPEANPGNCLYDGSSEQVNSYTFNRGFFVSRICGKSIATGILSCALAGQLNPPFVALHIVFLRPNTEAIITSTTAAGAVTSYSGATIYLKEPVNGTERCLDVTQVGQVSVLATCP